MNTLTLQWDEKKWKLPFNSEKQSLDLINLSKKRNNWEWKSLQLKEAKTKPSEVLTELLK